MSRSLSKQVEYSNISTSGALSELLAIVKVSNVSDVMAGTADIFVSISEAVTNERLSEELVHKLQSDCLIVIESNNVDDHSFRVRVACI